jgi:hypothetical protein
MLSIELGIDQADLADYPRIPKQWRDYLVVSESKSLH